MQSNNTSEWEIAVCGMQREETMSVLQGLPRESNSGSAHQNIIQLLKQSTTATCSEQAKSSTLPVTQLNTNLILYS